jgi:hypothetical protein
VGRTGQKQAILPARQARREGLTPPRLPWEATLQVVWSAVRDTGTEQPCADFPGAVLRHGECFSPRRLEGGNAPTGINGGKGGELPDGLSQQRAGAIPAFPHAGEGAEPLHQSDVPTFYGLMQASALMRVPGTGAPGSTRSVKEGQCISEESFDVYAKHGD